MSKLQTMEQVVLEVLEESTIARTDDYVLMYLVCEKLNPTINVVPFGMALYHHNTYKMPSWETVTRCRRKIQSKRPDLIDKNCYGHRRREKAVFEEYARS